MTTERRTTWRAWTIAAFAVAGTGTLACSPQQVPPRTAAGVLPSTGWIDATAMLDPATTPVYEGNAPIRLEFLKDMRKGDPVTLSA